MGDKDFFLSPDDSMTMGDIEYMRKPKRVRRTFPKTISNKAGFAVETEVSANEDRSGMFKGNSNNNNQNIAANTVFNPTPSTQNQAGVTGGSAVTQTEFEPQAASTPAPAPAPAPAPKPAAAPPEERRKADTSMDMFRNMAKNIRR